MVAGMTELMTGRDGSIVRQNGQNLSGDREK
jgi:hypothetical protein